MTEALIARLLGSLVLLLAIVTGSMYYGHLRYKEGARVTKLEWDTDRGTWQAALDKQKHEASSMLIQAQADADAANAKATQAAAKQEKDYETYMAGTAALAAQYAARSLRYAAPAATARCGTGGGPAMPSAASQAQSSPSAVVQLPDAIAGNLRQLTVDADNLRNAYGKCVAALNGGSAL